MIVSTESVVLNSRKFGDTSKIVTFYTKEGGLIKAVAKGSRASKNKFGSSLEPLSHSFISYYEKPEKDLFLLSKAETINPFRKITDSIDKIMVGLSILGSVSMTQENHLRNDELFALLIEVLTILNISDKNYYSLFVSFQIKLAHNLGFSLSFDFEEQPRYNEVYFSIESGCISSIRNGNNMFRLSLDKAIYLNKVENSSIENTINFAIDESDHKIINNLFANYYSFHLDKKFFYNAFNNYKL